MRKLLWILVAFVCLPMGCGKEGMSSGFYEGISGASGALSTSLQTKPAPMLNITAPSRGAYFTTSQTTVTVKGSVSDPNGYDVTYLRVANQILPIPQDGKFSVPAQLQPGMNLILGVAKNSQGGRSTAAIAVLQGEFRHDSQVIPNAAIVRIDKSGVEKIRQAVMPIIQNLDLEAKLKAKNPLYSGSNFFGSANLYLQTLSYSNPDIQLNLGQGSISVLVTLSNLDIVASVKGKVIGIPYSITGRITSSEVRFTTTAHLAISNGNLQIRFSNTSVQLNGFTFSFPNSNSVWNALANLAKNIVRDKIIDVTKTVIENKLPPFLTTFFQNIHKPIRKNLFGKDLEITLSPYSALVTPDAIFINMRSNVRVLGSQYTTSAPGSFYTPSQPPTFSSLPTGSQFAIALNDDFINRILFTAWKAKALDLDIDDQFFQKLNVQVPISLNGDLLLRFYPELLSHVNPTDPISIQIRPHLPPFVKVIGSPDLVETSLGEVELRFVVHQGALRRTALVVRTHIRVAATGSIQNNVLKLQFHSNPTILGDVSDTPLMPLDENKVELLLNIVVPVILPQMLKSIKELPLPTFNTITLDQVNLSAGGPSGDFVSISATLK